MRKIVIAIDGYSACGKSTTAKEVAKILGYRYIDSGAMYRAVTSYFLEHHVSLTNPKEIAKALSEIKLTFHINPKSLSEIYLNGLSVENEIRSMTISQHVSPVSAIKEVRTAMVEQQRKLGKDRGIVMDGRDIGTVVFPQADLKLFLSAEMQTRAFRRQKELLEKEELVDLDTIIENLRTRDAMDSSRAESPLKKADDAMELDTSFITIEEQVDEVVRMAISKMILPAKPHR